MDIHKNARRLQLHSYRFLLPSGSELQQVTGLALECLATAQNVDPEAHELLGKTGKALEEIKDKLAARREVLIQRTASDATS